MSAQVTHSPHNFFSDIRIVSRTGRPCDQSIPVEGRKWTLSTSNEIATIGSVENSSAATAAWGPSSRARGPGRPNASTRLGHSRQRTIQAKSPARPARPTHGETSLVGGAGGRSGERASVTRPR